MPNIYAGVNRPSNLNVTVSLVHIHQLNMKNNNNKKTCVCEWFLVSLPLSVVSADSSNTYFERVSEELEWIVNEIQFSPKDDSAPLPSSACVGDSRSSGDSL